jgi:ubiquinone/menaquinone biosynthesis C-methylase UbiE
MKTNFKEMMPKTMKAPEQLPESLEEGVIWQKANRSFWEQNPMRYDWDKNLEFKEHSKGFYEEIDSRFFSNVSEFMPWRRIPFDNLIDFDTLNSKDVLEIGVGNGSHAQLLAANAANFTGIDLTESATKSTSVRMSLLKLEAKILQMDAENLSFSDASFDFIWSWGVIHHSSNTDQILNEMYRVLKTGGQSVIMVYHRGWWNYYICGGLIMGIVLGNFFKTRSIFKTVQQSTDGALARYYTPKSWQNLAQAHGFKVDYVKVKGSKAELFPIPKGRLKAFLMSLMPNRISRFFMNRCNMGSFLISRITKI